MYNLHLQCPSSTLISGHDQIIQIFSTHLNFPVEITIKILSNLTIPNIHKILGANLNQLFVYVRKTGFEKFKNQLMEIGGYKINTDGSKKYFNEKDVFLV